MTKFSVSERFACRVLGQHRSTQRKMAKPRTDEAALTADIMALSRDSLVGQRMPRLLSVEGIDGVLDGAVERLCVGEGLAGEMVFGPGIWLCGFCVNLEGSST